jgi:uncharacterized protein (TIGR01777 family)
MKLLVTGSSGLVGSALLSSLQAQGHETAQLVRRGADPPKGRFLWDPAGGDLDDDAFAGRDAVIHLAGENIAGRWSAAKKKQIRDSRVDGTTLLAERLARCTDRPDVLVCASAIGYYGDRGAEELTEDASPASDFLGAVCQEWEAAAAPARDAGMRVVHLRFGVILSAAGGALAQMLLPFRLCVGGKVGSGRQYMSWLSLDEAVGIIEHALECDTLRGPVNAVAPAPVNNREFTRALGQALSRPTLLPMPAFAARMAFGEMADALLLASTRVVPAKLEASGYRFRHPEIGPALQAVLGKPAR